MYVLVHNVYQIYFIFCHSSDTDSAWSRFTSSVRARTNLAQVLNDVRADGALTFDWLFLLTVAAFVAAIGLVENSTVILVASMLISPLMVSFCLGEDLFSKSTLSTVIITGSLAHSPIFPKESYFTVLKVGINS